MSDSDQVPGEVKLRAAPGKTEAIVETGEFRVEVQLIQGTDGSLSARKRSVERLDDEERTEELTTRAERAAPSLRKVVAAVEREAATPEGFKRRHAEVHRRPEWMEDPRYQEWQPEDPSARGLLPVSELLKPQEPPRGRPRADDADIVRSIATKRIAGKTIPEIAVEVHYSKRTVERRIAQARERGLLD